MAAIENEITTSPRRWLVHATARIRRVPSVLACAALMCLAYAQAHAACMGTTVTSPFLPATVSISKTTGIGQVISSATITVTVTCDDTGLRHPSTNGWALNYTPQTPLVATSISQQTFATAMPGLGYRMYMPDGNLIAPTSYGTNGGDNFGANCMGAASGGVPCTMPLGTSTQTFRFRLDLVRTSTVLTSGTFSDSLMRFGYQDSWTGGSGPGPWTAQFGEQMTSPVTFRFIPPSCNLSAGTANQVITLPKISASSLPTIGSTAGATRFGLTLENCVTQSIVTMNISGDATAVGSVLRNNGSAQGVGLQMLNGGPAGTPLPLNADVGMGNVGAAMTMAIPLGVRYYRVGPVTPGTVDSVATVNFNYN